MRTIIIGDIHGCLEEFEELLNKLQYNKNTDRLILLGDLIDRGPDSVGVVRKAREFDLECVRGNHEVKFLKWYNGNKFYDAHKHYNEFSDDDVSYINRMPFYIKITDDLWILHAGIKPGLSLDKQKKDDFVFLRYTDENRKFISIKKIAAGEAEDAKFWTSFGPFGANVVYGHEVHSMSDIRIDKFDDGTACYGIDTGCCFGGKLTALIWDTKEIVQVQAKKEYYKPFEFRKGK